MKLNIKWQQLRKFLNYPLREHVWCSGRLLDFTKSQVQRLSFKDLHQQMIFRSGYKYENKKKVNMKLKVSKSSSVDRIFLIFFKFHFLFHMKVKNGIFHMEIWIFCLKNKNYFYFI